MTKEVWGNIELPGFDDSKLFDPYVNKKIAAMDPVRREKMGAPHRGKTSNNKGVVASIETRELMSKARTGKKHSKESSLKKREALGSPIKTPLGIFVSQSAAVEFYIEDGLTNARKKIQKWIKTDPTNYYYITKEEYAKHMEENCKTN